MNNHVCHVINTLSTGGAEHYVVNLSNFLNSNGMRASIIAGEPQTLRDKVAPGVHVETLELHPGANKSLLKYIRNLRSTCKELVSYFRREQVTVVHTHLAASALPAWIAAKICGIPVFHSKMHAVKISSLYERILFGSCLPLIFITRYVVFSNFMRDEAHKYWHAPFHKIFISSIGVDTSSFIYDPSSKLASRQALNICMTAHVILVVARLHPDKDVELAIRAARYLNDPSAVLIIVGDGQERAKLEELVRDLPGQTQVRFLGHTNDPRSAYASADALLQTSRSPNIGTVVLEAMATGLPVLIAYRNEEERFMAMDTFDNQPLGHIAHATPALIAECLESFFAELDRDKNFRHIRRDFIRNRHDKQLAFSNLADCYRSHYRSGAIINPAIK